MLVAADAMGRRNAGHLSGKKCCNSLFPRCCGLRRRRIDLRGSIRSLHDLTGVIRDCPLFFKIELGFRDFTSVIAFSNRHHSGRERSYRTRPRIVGEARIVGQCGIVEAIDPWQNRLLMAVWILFLTLIDRFIILLGDCGLLVFDCGIPRAVTVMR